MRREWEQWLREPKNRQTLCWLGAVLAALVISIWAVETLGADGFSKLIDSFAKLLGALVWPQ